MSQLDTLIKIDISLKTGSVPKEAFSIPLIIGSTDAGWSVADRVHSYTDPASMLDDGFDENDPEYKYAVQLMQQEISPAIFYVGYHDAGNTIADDLDAIIEKNNQWYGVVLCSNVKQDILDMAAAIETRKKFYLACTADADVVTNVNTDVVSALKALGYNRTAIIYSAVSADKGIDAAWMGGQLPQTPGSNNWAYKTLVGITADELSDTKRTLVIGTPVAQLPGKNGNIYTTIGGVGITQMGLMVSGRPIDIQIGLDWLDAEIQSNLYASLSQSAKIPFTNKGANVLVQGTRAALDTGVGNGLIDGDSEITCSAADVLTIPASQRANRLAPPIKFKCRFQGAINAATVEGTVTL